MNGKTIRLYLVDGVSNGILTAELINWTGKILVAPRISLPELSRRDEVKRTGIYVVVGPDPERPERDRVYIGEGDNVLTRLVAHDKDETKDFWTRAVVVISKDENLTKAHGRYLESRLIELAKEAQRASMANGTCPPAPLLPEPDVADMEYFLNQIQLIFPVLGMDFLQQKPSLSATSGQLTSPRFVIESVGVHARAAQVGDEFVVLEGSTARKEGVASWDTYRTLRDSLVAEGKLVDDGDSGFYTFREDVAFSSPSAAGSVVLARNCNGRRDWLVEGEGVTYAQWYESQLDSADVEHE